MDSADRDLARAYLVKARNKARVARELLNMGEWDDAVSRAYYAAFHAAQAALLTEGQRPQTHRGVVTLFGLLLVQTGKLDRKWGRLLTSLKDDREASDYEAFSWIDQETARRAAQEAEQFLAAIEQYLKPVLS